MTDERPSPTTLAGRTALVTGGTRGIGRAVAAALGAAGARVALTGTRRADAEAAARELASALGAEIHGAECDVRSEESVAALARSVREALGGLDLLVNNAGLGIYRPTPALPTADFARVIETNLTGAYRVVRAVLPLLLDSGRRRLDRRLDAPEGAADPGALIVNLGSLAGRHPFRGGAAYNASKFGLIGLTEALMLDLRDQGIRCSVVMPGSVATGFAGRSPEDGRDWKLHPEDVAEAVLQVALTRPEAHQSRIELRPSLPPAK